MPEPSSRLNGQRATRLKQIVAYIISQMVSWLLWRIVLGLTLGLFALIALYQFTVAGILALELQVGALNAHLIMAGVFTVAAFVVLAIMVMTRPRNPMKEHAEDEIAQARALDIAMLVEAVMLGFTMSRKKPRE